MKRGELLRGATLTQNIDLRQSKRLYYLDNLKVFLTFLVIVHHAGQAYGPTGGFWQYKSSLNENVPWLGSFYSVNAAFFMGLFFMISGYFLPGSFDRKGNKEFIKDKLVRYGFPVLLVFLLIEPLEMYFYYSLYSGNKQIDFITYLINIYFGIDSRPSWFKETIGWPEMNFGHLWFVEHLLVYSLMYWLIRQVFFKERIQTGPSDFGYLHIFTLSLLTALVTAVVRIWYPIDEWVGILGFIQSEVAHLPQYMILFITGIISFRKGWFERIDKKVGNYLLSIGILMSILVYSNFMLPKSMRMILFENWAFYESFLAVFLCWGLVVLFREKINNTSIIAKFLAENSYAAYIFHFPIVLALQYGLDKVYIFGALGKFLTVSVLSIIITYSVSCAIRKLPNVGRVI